MKNPILIVVEGNFYLADQTLRLVQAQGLLVRLTVELREACDLLQQRLDIVLLAAPLAVAAVRATLFNRNRSLHPRQQILVVAKAGDSRKASWN